MSATMNISIGRTRLQMVRSVFGHFKQTGTTTSAFQPGLQPNYEAAVHGGMAGRSLMPPASVAASTYSMADLNAGSTPLPRHHENALPKPIGFGRPVSRTECYEEPTYRQYHQEAIHPMPARLPDNVVPAEWHTYYTLPSSYSRFSHPQEAVLPLSQEGMTLDFPPYIPREEAWHSAPPESFASLPYNSSWESSPALSTLSTAPSSPSLPPAPQEPRCRKGYGPFDPCSREDVLEFGGVAPLSVGARIAAYHALQDFVQRDREDKVALEEPRRRKDYGPFDPCSREDVLEFGGVAPLSVGARIAAYYALQASVQRDRDDKGAPQKPRTRKHHGPYDACTREDTLAELEEDQFDAVPLAMEARIAAYYALAEGAQAEQEDKMVKRSDGDEDGNGWSLAEMERYTTSVRNRLLAAYHTHPPALEKPTALRGLPVVVQVRVACTINQTRHKGLGQERNSWHLRVRSASGVTLSPWNPRIGGRDYTVSFRANWPTCDGSQKVTANGRRRSTICEVIAVDHFGSDCMPIFNPLARKSTSSVKYSSTFHSRGYLSLIESRNDLSLATPDVGMTWGSIDIERLKSREWTAGPDHPFKNSVKSLEDQGGDRIVISVRESRVESRQEKGQINSSRCVSWIQGSDIRARVIQQRWASRSCGASRNAVMEPDCWGQYGISSSIVLSEERDLRSMRECRSSKTQPFRLATFASISMRRERIWGVVSIGAGGAGMGVR
ncbi:hypothetical protein B0H17DRAFT_1134048 [Mycena rosella]|uniref:Uncharacterized protein n=1 Tax=Mycena rosella TaxID=1033263 RepID=A0AAD7GER3_MYCRO|nr:hypothetical protein B0H17DRAFT_1134048 [Mycena rosella]